VRRAKQRVRVRLLILIFGKMPLVALFTEYSDDNRSSKNLIECSCPRPNAEGVRGEGASSRLDVFAEVPRLSFRAGFRELIQQKRYPPSPPVPLPRRGEGNRFHGLCTLSESAYTKSLQLEQWLRYNPSSTKHSLSIDHFKDCDPDIPCACALSAKDNANSWHARRCCESGLCQWSLWAGK